MNFVAEELAVGQKSMKNLFGLENEESNKQESLKAKDPMDISSKPERPNSGGSSGRRRNNQITFDDDANDLLSGLDSIGSKKPAVTKPRSNFMDDLFGDAKVGTNTEVKKDFVLSDQYKTKDSKPVNALSVPKADPLRTRPSSAGRERRRGAPTTKGELDLDDDKLFQGTSLASTNKAIEPESRPAAPWENTQAKPAPWENSQAKPDLYKPMPLPVMKSEELLPETKEMMQKHQMQMEQLQRLEKDQLDQFQKDLEDQKAFIESKQRDHKLALEQQKSLCQQQVVHPHE